MRALVARPAAAHVDPQLELAGAPSWFCITANDAIFRRCAGSRGRIQRQLLRGRRHLVAKVHASAEPKSSVRSVAVASAKV